MTKHIPVLFEEVRELLHLKKGMIVVDATLGGGGHASMMLECVLPTGRVIAFDADEEALHRFRLRITADARLDQAFRDGKLVLVHGNYSEMTMHLERLSIGSVDAILADLGFSSDQIEASERGLSFQQDGPLDMRLDQSKSLSAAHIVNEYSLGALERILSEYGDEGEARRIARAIVKRRLEKVFETTGELRTLIEEVYPKKLRYATVRPGSRQGKIHPATKTFQALRIAANKEFEHLESFLGQTVDCLSKGGRLAVITFHSGEDKRVKQFLKEQARGCICPPNFPICRCGHQSKIRILTKKPIVSNEEELAQNPRARSAKLRGFEKL